MKFLIVCLYFLVGLINAADLAKIFKNGMVLQSNPTTAVIWGWQDGNPDDWPPVYLTADCENDDGMFKINKRFISKKVRVLKICQLSSQKNLQTRLDLTEKKRLHTNIPILDLGIVFS